VYHSFTQAAAAAAAGASVMQIFIGRLRVSNNFFNSILGSLSFYLIFALYGASCRIGPEIIQMMRRLKQPK
jgi:hypothetical protein